MSYHTNKQTHIITMRLLKIGEIQTLASETSADMRGFRLFLKDKFLNKFKKDSQTIVVKLKELSLILNDDDDKKNLSTSQKNIKDGMN